MILKAGTYRFNDVLNIDKNIEQIIDFTTVFIDGEQPQKCDAIKIGTSLQEGDYTYTNYMQYKFTADNLTDQLMQLVYAELPFEGWLTSLGFSNSMKEITILKDTEVSDDFGNYYISSTNYNEINAPSYLAEITYNGQVIASLNAGETATLKCGPTEDTKYVMASDVVVKVNKVEEPVDDSIIGTWVFRDTIDFSAFPIDDVNRYSYFFIFSDSDTMAYNSIYIQRQLDNSQSKIYYRNTLVYNDEMWDDDIFKTINIFTDFTYTNYDYSAFKIFLKANAIKQ